MSNDLTPNAINLQPGIDPGADIDPQPGRAPDDPAVVATRLVSQCVITWDPDGAVNAVHALRAAEPRQRLIELLRHGPWRATALTAHLDQLRENPSDPEAYRAASTSLAESIKAGFAPPPDLLAALRAAEEVGYTRYRLGNLATADTPATTPDTAALAALPAAPLSPDKSVAQLAIVLPVRFAHETDKRLRNCLAALHALNRQYGDRRRFRLVVVEQGERPVGRPLIEGIVDDYVFVTNPGPFNKSWALNVGVLTAGATPYLCLIDADSLVQPDFVTGVLDRMHGGVEAELPFTELLFLDQPATARAITQRLIASQDAGTVADPRTMRGFALLGVNGFCVCVTREIFDRIDGYDERYLGWGDDDNEFYRQVAGETTVVRSSGTMLHLWHERPPMLIDGGRRPNSHLIGVPRPADREPIGRHDKYATLP